MSKEGQIYHEISQEFEEYIAVVYPVDAAAVEKVIKVANSHGTSRLSAPEWLFWNRAQEAAERIGIEKNNQFSMTDPAPVVLAALKIMEKDIPPQERKLTPEKHVQLLMKAELTTAHIQADYSDFQSALGHIKKYTILDSFRKGLAEVE